MPNLLDALSDSENTIDLQDENLITPIHEFLEINPEKRLITIPESEQLFGVYGENKVEIKYFKCPRIILNDIDLYECYIFINYISASGKIGYIQADTVVLDETENYIIFTWELTRNVFDENIDADIYFSISAKQYLEDKEPVFFTRKAKGNLYETVYAEEQITEQYADIVLQLLAKMDSVEEQIALKSDWNQNDETASDYVKNRPFYTENEGQTTVILEETDYGEIDEFVYLEQELEIEAGKTYIVTWNGIEYECEAKVYAMHETAFVGLGNASLLSPEKDTGEPFAIGVITGQPMTMIMPLGAVEGSVSVPVAVGIVRNDEVVHKLPNKYLDLDWKPTKEYKLTDVFQINNVTFTGKEITLIDSQVFYLHVGEEYTVNWNGTEYVCEAKRIDADPFSVFYIGNTELTTLTNKEDTGEPFIYVYYATHANTNAFYAKLIKSNSTAETITCRVKGYTDVYNKIPTNFLPDSYVIPTDIDAGLVINELRLADKAFQEGRRVYARKGGVFGQVIYLGFDSVDSIYNQMWFVSDSKMFYIWSYEYSSTNGVAKTNYIVVGLVPDISGTRGYSVPVPSEMKAGQMVRLKSIDESKTSGYNMAWEAVDPWVIESSTAGSTKKFKLTVDDSGTISTTEVTE